MSEQHRAAGRSGWTPERRETWRQWVLQNRPWERVKVRKTPEWRDHLASICKKVDGIKSKDFREEKWILREAVAHCQASVELYESVVYGSGEMPLRPSS
jgi:hypothetical protein